MSDVTSLLQRIERVNMESQRLANERNQNLGRRNALEKQLHEALADYNKTYGTAITESTIEQELQRVYVEKEKEVALVEEVLTLVESGRYAEAEQKLGIEPVNTGVQAEVSSPVVQSEMASSVVNPQQGVVSQAEPVNDGVGNAPIQNPNYKIPDLKAAVQSTDKSSLETDDFLAPPPEIPSFSQFIKGKPFEMEGGSI